MTHGDGFLSGRYRLIAEVAQGGMAAVWRAEDTLLDRMVAVKVLHPQYAKDPEFLERFRREARAAARLSHPNIVPIYDVGEQDGRPYIVMELVEGGNLKDRIRSAAPLPDAEIRSIGATLASTLDYAHRKGLIHRDVKPQNVLLGEDARPRLTDFGIAQAAASAGLTRTGTIMGSVQYIAPELVHGRPASPRSDVYSLGAVLYEMATGRVPFQGETDVAVALAHVEQTVPPPRALNGRLAPDLEATILRALAKDPDMRFASGLDMAGALRTGRASGPVVPVAAVAPVASDVTRRMSTQPAAGRSSAATQRRATTAVAAAPAPVPRRTARPYQPRGASNGMVGLLVALAVVLLALGVGFYGLATLSRQGIGSGDPTPPPTAIPTAAPTAPAKPAAVPPTNTPAPAPTSTPEPPPPPTETPLPPTAVPSPLPPTPSPVPPTPTRVPPTPTPRVIAVPQLGGKTLEEAQAALAQAGLTVTVRGINANVDKNVVADQSPDAGTSLPPGGTVALSVGTGSTAVPDVLNLPRDQAVKTLQNSSFRPILRDQRDNRVPAGSASGTNPKAGTIVPRGSQVELDISSGR